MSIHRSLLTTITLVAWPLAAQERRTESHLGSVAEIARSIHRERGFPLEYARRGNLSVDEWRRRARAEVRHQLSYWPKTVALDLKVHAVVKRDGYEVRTISFAGLGALSHSSVPARADERPRSVSRVPLAGTVAEIARVRPIGPPLLSTD